MRTDDAVQDIYDRTLAAVRTAFVTVSEHGDLDPAYGGEEAARLAASAAAGVMRRLWRGPQ